MGGKKPTILVSSAQINNKTILLMPFRYSYMGTAQFVIGNNMNINQIIKFIISDFLNLNFLDSSNTELSVYQCRMCILMVE